MLLLLVCPLVFVLCYAWSADTLPSAWFGLAGGGLLAAGLSWRRRHRGSMADRSGTTGRLDWVAAEPPPVCPRCQNSGMYWAALTKPCPADHLIGSRCGMCSDQGVVVRHQPVACVHLTAVAPA